MLLFCCCHAARLLLHAMLLLNVAPLLLLCSCSAANHLLPCCCSVDLLLLCCFSITPLCYPAAACLTLHTTANFYSILSSKSRPDCSSILLSYLFWEQFGPIFLKRSRRFNGCINYYMLQSLLRIFLGLTQGWAIEIVFFHGWPSDPCKKQSINLHRPASANILSLPNRNIILWT